jgi:heme o synthase
VAVRSLEAPAPVLVGLRRALHDRLETTKPKVTLLLLAFGLVAMVVAAADGAGAGVATATPLRLALFACLGFMAAGGAAALNHYFDRDIDAVMVRTRRRPLPSGRLAPRDVLGFAVTLLGTSLPLAAFTLGPWTAFWMAAGAATYAGLYTLVLKRRTRQNIVIGGLAGSCGVLAGWAVVDPTLAPGAWLLALVVFLWTPPHFWGLAIARDDDYRAVRVPMLPQTHGVPATATAMLVYALAMVAASLLLVPVTVLGVGYLIAAALLGAGFVAVCLRTWRSPTARHAGWAFKLSGAYLGLLLVAMVVDLMV